MIQIVIKHGLRKFYIEVSPDYRLSDLQEEAQRVTGVPESRQKLIYNGFVLLPDPDYEGKTLKEYGLRNESKVILLGKTYDPSQDPSLQKVLEVDKKRKTLENSLQELLLGENGSLRELTSLNEAFMKLLEELDSLTFEEPRGNAKAQRKIVATALNASLDKIENAMSSIQSRKSKP